MFDSTMKDKSFNLKTLVKLSLLIALSGVGALIRIQGSIAFDSLPAFFAALYLSPALGGIVGLLGHLFSAMITGFPLTIPMHIFVSLQMWLIVYLFGFLWRRTNWKFAVATAILLNGPVAAIVAVPVSSFLGLPLSGWSLFMVIWLSLTLASIFNVLLAAYTYKRIGGNVSVQD